MTGSTIIWEVVCHRFDSLGRIIKRRMHKVSPRNMKLLLEGQVADKCLCRDPIHKDIQMFHKITILKLSKWCYNICIYMYIHICIYFKLCFAYILILNWVNTNFCLTFFFFFFFCFFSRIINFVYVLYQ